MAHAGGRPTKYRKEYCKQLLSYFNIPAYTVSDCEFQNKDGTVSVKEKVTPCDLPLIIDFCMKIDISPSTFHQWVAKYPEFSNAYNKCKELQASILVRNTLNGYYDARFASLAAKNMIGWRDRNETELSGKDGKDLIPSEIRINIMQPEQPE